MVCCHLQLLVPRLEALHLDCKHSRNDLQLATGLLATSPPSPKPLLMGLHGAWPGKVDRCRDPSARSLAPTQTHQSGPAWCAGAAPWCPAHSAAWTLPIPPASAVCALARLRAPPGRCRARTLQLLLPWLFGAAEELGSALVGQGGCSAAGAGQRRDSGCIDRAGESNSEPRPMLASFTRW